MENLYIIHLDLDDLIISFLNSPLDLIALGLTNTHYYIKLAQQLYYIKYLSNKIKSEQYRFAAINKIKWYFRHELNGRPEKHSKLINEFFRTSCTTRDLSAVKFIMDFAVEQGLVINIHEKNELAVRHACSNNSVDIVEYLFSLGPTHGPINIGSVCRDLLCDTISHPDLGLFKYIMNQLKNIKKKYNIHHNDEELFRTAASSGNINGCKYLIELGEESGTKINIHVWDDCVMKRAASMKRSDLIAYLQHLGLNGYRPYSATFHFQYLMEDTW